MNTVILFLGEGASWSPEEWALQQGGAMTQYGKVVVQRGVEWISVARCERIIDECDEAELRVLSATLGHPVPFLIEWRGAQLLEELIRSVPEACNAMIDNDHGLIVPVGNLRNRPLDSWIRSKGTSWLSDS